MTRGEAICLKSHGLTMYDKVDVIRQRMKVNGRYRHLRGTGDGYMGLGTEMRALMEGEDVERHGSKAVGD